MPSRKSAATAPQALNAALNRAKRMAQGMEGVHAVDYGYHYVDGVRTDRVGLRFHVRDKRSPAELKGSQVLPRQIAGIDVDVLESRYRPHAADPRAAQPALSPGLSIGNVTTSETGTLGALVKDAAGTAWLLSHWHVLVGGPEAAPGDVISQPGPMHLGANPARPVAILDRSLAPSEQLDAALARIDPGIAMDPTVFNLGLKPGSVSAPVLGARLTKSGAVSGVTKAMVDGVGGSYQLDYSGFGLGPLWMRGFRLVRDPASAESSISETGDSGALWVDAALDTAVGLHFAGEDDDTPLNDYALAHSLDEVLARLNVRLA